MGPGFRRGSDGGWEGLGEATSAGECEGWEVSPGTVGAGDALVAWSASANGVLPQASGVPVEGFAVA